VRVATVAALRRLKHPGVKSFLADSSEWVLREAISAVHDDESIPEALPVVADLLPSNTSQSEAITRRLLSANLRVGKAVNAERLLAYALDQSKPSAMRAEALLCLGDWNRRPFVDRVEGRVRELSRRDDSLAKKLISANLQDFFEASDSELLAELIRLCEKLQIKLGAKSLLVIAKSESQDLSARVQAIQSVQANKTQDASDQLASLLKSKHPEIQVAAVGKLAEIEPKTFAARLETSWRTLSLPAQQTFLTELGTATSDRGDEILSDALVSLFGGEFSKALELDVVTSAKARQTPKLKQLVTQHESRQSAEDPVASYRSTLVGGQPAKGKLVYENHVAAQCVRCHNAGGKGKQVGPELGGIGKRVNKDYLLRSLITPSVDIAEGFGVTVVELSNGEVLAGSIGNRTKKTLTLIPPQGKIREIPVNSIKNITESKTSVMPPVGAILTKHELRDLMAYLETL
jgi:quinoprotein glucose dehydrogenase